MRSIIGSVVLILLVGVLTLVWWGRIPASFTTDRIELPPGFQISLYASGISGARGVAPGPDGVVFVTSKDTGALYVAVDADADGRAEDVRAIVTDLTMPHGVTYHGNDLYLAEVGRILRFDSLAYRLDDPPDPVILTDDLPADTWHGFKPLGIGPDERLYVAVGSPCNVCDRDREGFGQIVSMNLDGTGRTVYARGIRNSVGFDWHPRTGELWFTDNGRDLLGNNAPPDELNRVANIGSHFGFPYCHGGSITDEAFGREAGCGDFVSPAQALDPHVAPLGMVFYDGDMFPEKYHGTIFIAEHGSWNRVPPSGYRISTVSVEDTLATGYATFASGWLRAGRVSGRPVDLAVASDGALLVSDDMNGNVYRISYGSQSH